MQKVSSLGHNESSEQQIRLSITRHSAVSGASTAVKAVAGSSFAILLGARPSQESTGLRHVER